MPGLVLRKVLVGCVSCLLMHARSAERGGVAVGFLQVRQSLLVQLHGVPGQPALDLPIPPLKPAAQKWRDQRHLSSLITHRLVLAVSLLFSFLLTHKHTWTLITGLTAGFSFWFVLLVTHEAASHSYKMKSIKKPKYSNVVVLSSSCQSFGSWLNEFRVNMSVHRMDERKHQKPTCNFLSQAKSFIWAPAKTSDPWREGSDCFRALQSLCSITKRAFLLRVLQGAEAYFLKGHSSWKTGPLLLFSFHTGKKIKHLAVLLMICADDLIYSRTRLIAFKMAGKEGLTKPKTLQGATRSSISKVALRAWMCDNCLCVFS